MQTLVQDLEDHGGWFDMRSFHRLAVYVHCTCIKERVSRRIEISDCLWDFHLPCHNLAGFNHLILLRKYPFEWACTDTGTLVCSQIRRLWATAVCRWLYDVARVQKAWFIIISLG